MVDQIQAAQLMPILRAMAMREAGPNKRRAKGVAARNDEKDQGEGIAFTVAEEPDAHEAFLVRTLAEVLVRNANGASPRKLLQDARNGRIDWRTPGAYNPEIMFLAQRIAQEILGNGLYYEPWAEVIAAYRRVQPLGTPEAKPERALNFRS